MMKLTAVVFSAMLFLGLGVTSLSASSHGENAKKEVPAEKCGTGKCGDSKKKVPAEKSGSEKCGDSKKEVPTEKSSSGKCG